MKKRTKILIVIIALIIAASLLGAAIAVVFIKRETREMDKKTDNLSHSQIHFWKSWTKF